MAVAFLFEGQGVTAEQYDAVMDGIGRGSLDAPAPEGCISHISGPTADGWRVVDVWETEAHAGRFYGSETFQKSATANLPDVQPDAWSLHRIEVYEPVRAVD